MMTMTNDPYEVTRSWAQGVDAFTKKYYRPGWKYYYLVDFDELAREAGVSYYTSYADSRENYERVRLMIDKRYREWQKAEE